MLVYVVPSSRHWNMLDRSLICSSIILLTNLSDLSLTVVIFNILQSKHGFFLFSYMLQNVYSLVLYLTYLIALLNQDDLPSKLHSLFLYIDEFVILIASLIFDLQFKFVINYFSLNHVDLNDEKNASPPFSLSRQREKKAPPILPSPSSFLSLVGVV